jgi:protein-S-isoprenylcysteine O-methyltransferase Ste14
MDTNKEKELTFWGASPLFFNSWLLLTIPCFMYFMVKIFINEEEKLLEKKFGKEYIDYKKVTYAIFPKFW